MAGPPRQYCLVNGVYKVRIAAIPFSSLKYTEIVDVDIRFSQSAFKHDVSEADIRTAFDNALYDERLDDSDGEEEINARYLLMDFDRNANPLEVLYNVIDEDTIKIFHAMKCRNVYVPLIKRKE